MKNAMNSSRGLHKAGNQEGIKIPIYSSHEISPYKTYNVKRYDPASNNYNSRFEPWNNLVLSDRFKTKDMETGVIPSEFNEIGV
jgi:hypothetical protein